MKKLFLVGNDLNYFFSHRLPVAIGAMQVGFEVHVCVPSSTRVNELKSYGFVFHDIPMKRGLGFFADFRLLVYLYKLYKKEKPDVIHHVTIKPVLYGSLVCRVINSAKIVNSITGLGYVFTSNTFKAKVLRIIVSFFYSFLFRSRNMSIIFQNKDDVDVFIKKKFVKSKQVFLIRGSGVDTSIYKETSIPNVQDKNVLIVLPARMLWDKGIGEFVEAAKILKKDGLQARFVLVGGVDYENPEFISEEQLTLWVNKRIVEWWGFRSDIYEIFAQSSIICLPSYREGLPKALIEGMSVGRPIVTTNVPGCREVVQNGVNGFLVPKQDSVILAEALRKLICDRKLMLAFGRASRDMAVKFFDVKQVVEQTLRVYSLE